MKMKSLHRACIMLQNLTDWSSLMNLSEFVLRHVCGYDTWLISMNHFICTLYGVKHDMSNRWTNTSVLCIGSLSLQLSLQCLLSSDLHHQAAAVSRGSLTTNRFCRGTSCLRNLWKNWAWKYIKMRKELAGRRLIIHYGCRPEEI